MKHVKKRLTYETGSVAYRQRKERPLRIKNIDRQ